MAEQTSAVKRRTMGSVPCPDASAILTKLHATDPAVKGHAAAPPRIAGTDRPQEGDRLGEGKVTLPPVHAMSVGQAASNAGIGGASRMPDFAYAVIKLSIAREAAGSEKLKSMAAQVKEQLGDIDSLLELSSELTLLPDKESNDLSDKMRGLIGKLEIHKIQVWKGDGKISKEKLGEMKAQIGAQIDKLRTALQTKISTEIQPEVNNLQSIMNIVQQIIQSDARLKKKTAEVPR